MSEKRKLIIATGNAGKVREIKEVLSELPLDILSLKDLENPPEIIEDKDNFVGNALKKAIEICNYCGEITLADDSGLEVEALEGKPGVLSARFSGPGANDESNNRLLLEKLKGLSSEERTAYFKCAMVIVSPSGEREIIEESCKGLIGGKEVGEGGFGYDPLFYYPPLGITFAEMDLKIKNKISHRGKALQKIKPAIIRFLD